MDSLSSKIKGCVETLYTAFDFGGNYCKINLISLSIGVFGGVFRPSQLRLYKAFSLEIELLDKLAVKE